MSGRTGQTTGDSIDVTVPARTELASTVRLLAASFGADVGFSVDEIDDLRLALNEVFTTAAESGRAERVAVSFVPGERRIDVRISTVPPADIELDALAATILASVVADLVNEDGVITFTKSTERDDA